MASQVELQVTKLVAPLLAQEGYELVELEYRKKEGRWVLTLYIDHPKGITLADCERVSKKVEVLLDQQDPIPHRYFLEVSSPGINRPLKKDADYQRFQGREVTINTFAPVSGKKYFRGRLEGLEEDKVILQEREVTFLIPKELIASARLVGEL